MTTDSAPTDGFSKFGLSEPILSGVRDAGFTLPSPIQAAAIPLLLAGRDLVAQAQTGTGKTAAFGLPGMSKLDPKLPGVQMLVITPTRELCAQVADELFKLGKNAHVRTVAVYGGANGYRQVEQIQRGAQVVVATPGRLLDHLDSGRLPKFAPAMVVLDEADEMLDMGFLEDIERIFKHLPEGAPRQTCLFSATMPAEIKRLADRILKDPARVDLTNTETFKTDVEQFYYVIEEHERVVALTRLIDAEEPKRAIVFCRTKREVDDIATVLVGRGCAAKALHGDLDQRQRQDAVAAFKKGTIEVLVATDVASRGLDIQGVSHVFNFRMPMDQEAYVHRIGRTGRAGAKGKAATLVTPWEFHGLRRIQHAIKASFIHGELPSLTEINRRRDRGLVETIIAQVPHEDAIDVLAQLTEAMDVCEVAMRLISMLLERERKTIDGPEKIGTDARKRVERMIAQGSAPRQQGNYYKGGYQGRGQGGGYQGRGQGTGYQGRGQGTGYQGRGQGTGYQGKRDTGAPTQRDGDEGRPAIPAGRKPFSKPAYNKPFGKPPGKRPPPRDRE
ncbi:MAG TPA: DEAD/DEAH box helicase [Planctomycetota bacterium]|nr:DEAD/DEAH box helicase [Planctomycetota bacterium]